MNMNFEEFKKKLVAEVMNYMPEEIKDTHVVTISECLKVNTKLTGLSLHRIDNSPCFSPTLYCEYLFEEYNDYPEIEMILEKTANILFNSLKTAPDISIFSDRSWLDLDKVCIKIVNTEANTQLLQAVPHRDFLNLSIIYYVAMNEENTVTITNQIMEKYDISEQILWEKGFKNTPECIGLKVKNMVDFFKEFMYIDDSEERFDAPINYMYLIGAQHWGAVALLYDKLLSDVAERINDNLFIFPSSIHEIVCISASSLSSTEGLEMVKSINQTEIRPEEFLADSVYFYDREKHELSIACTDKVSVQ